MFGFFAKTKPVDSMVKELMPILDNFYGVIRSVDCEFEDLYIPACYVASIAIIPIKTKEQRAEFCSAWLKHITELYSSHGRPLSQEKIFDELRQNYSSYQQAFTSYLNKEDVATNFGELLLKNCRVDIPDRSNIVYLDVVVPFLIAVASMSCDILAVSQKYY